MTDLARLSEQTMPEAWGQRLDVAAATWRALDDERRRLSRLGFELPLARCEQQIRFWEFATRLLSLPKVSAERIGAAR